MKLFITSSSSRLTRRTPFPSIFVPLIVCGYIQSLYIRPRVGCTNQKVQDSYPISRAIIAFCWLPPDIERAFYWLLPCQILRHTVQSSRFAYLRISFSFKIKLFVNCGSKYLWHNIIFQWVLIKYKTMFYVCLQIWLMPDVPSLSDWHLCDIFPIHWPILPLFNGSNPDESIYQSVCPISIDSCNTHQSLLYCTWREIHCLPHCFYGVLKQHVMPSISGQPSFWFYGFFSTTN